ncbi:hypothetical protein OG520_45160 (plasmid) [Streptomyces sp. NBC_00984]|uniref:hypothetical protein n=1 Tax=Streptomyces sp. NBC_00984 TaxID=2903700 RepID=UPI002F918052|nr:hypothetical protein OG520_45160 [Streptomyces sp. NBC_00984]
MKKFALVAAPLALAASLAFAPTASAAPSDTPALGCVRVFNLDRPPLGLDIDAVKRVATLLGLPGVPNRLGMVCETPQQTDAEHGVVNYPRHGPIILRNIGSARLQEYCTDSVSEPGATAPLPGTDIITKGLVVFGSGCVTEPNPIAV